ncbi:cupin domain-containing protein [Cohnella yongneupensis]|uniref:Cupin domain-containing protein n=1 Tax=Cohnella yongneupensis TaxID=425006 RepID=A0ABW0QYI5_9BACL
MAVSYMDFTSPSVQYFFDLSKNRSFTKDGRNYINALGIDQLNTLGNVSLLDIYMSRGNVVEPHIHQNASELVYCIAGGEIVSILNPFTKTVLNFKIAPGQVANIPQGWFHWELATEDNTHLLAIFDAPVPEFIAVSDFLRLAPRNMLAHTYCLDEALIAQALAPIKSTTTIGPPVDCVPKPQQRHVDAGQAQHPHAVYPGYAAPSSPESRTSDYPGIGNGFNRR